MMARLPRLVVPGLPHHVIQRGNNRQAIFCDDIDRSRFLEILLDVSRTHEAAIHAYVLMANHVHLIATPALQSGLGLAMQSLGRRYVGWFNARHDRTGTLWEGRYRCAVVESERYLIPSMRYVELNPVRAGLVVQPGTFFWSSAGFHLGHRRDPLVTDPPQFWALGNTPFEREAAWKRLLEQPLTHQESRLISESALKGWPCGGDAFLKWLSENTGRPVAPRPKGRPASK